MPSVICSYIDVLQYFGYIDFETFNPILEKFSGGWWSLFSFMDFGIQELNDYLIGLKEL